MSMIGKPHAVRPVKGAFIGLTTVDIILGLEKYPKEDSKNTATQYTIAAGGPASNAAAAFSYLGGEARLLSYLGRSDISRIARRDLEDQGVYLVDIPRDDLNIDIALSAISISEANGSRTIVTSPEINAEMVGRYPDTQVAALLENVDILLLDGHQVKLAAQVAKHARERGVTVVLDGDLYRPSIEEVLPLVDIVIFGKSFEVAGEPCGRDAFEYFESFGIERIISTNGARPIEFLFDGSLGSIDVKEVPVVDTLGAGDFFHGAFCYSFSRDMNFHDALRFAAKIASKSVTIFGTREWMKVYEPSDFK